MIENDDLKKHAFKNLFSYQMKLHFINWNLEIIYIIHETDLIYKLRFKKQNREVVVVTI